jgi:hypothetical protein
MARDGTVTGVQNRLPGAGKSINIGKMGRKQRTRMFHDFSVDEGLEETEFKGKSEVHSVFYIHDLYVLEN